MVETRVVCASVRRAAVVACMAGLVLGFAADTQARVTRIEFGAPTSACGGNFAVGPYEQLDGIAHGEIDPKDPLNAGIQDIRLAPRNERGMIEYSSTVSILKPCNMGSSNHAMLFEIVNRGNKLNPGFFNVATAGRSTPDDGFLENQGFTLVWAGWQADLVPPPPPHPTTPPPPRVTMFAPIAHEHNGHTITGPVRSEFIVRALTASQPILADSSSNTPGYPTASLDNSHDTMTMRHRQDSRRVVIPNSDWTYADCALPGQKDTPPPPVFPGTPNAQKVCLKHGFDPDHIYELLYT